MKYLGQFKAIAIAAVLITFLGQKANAQLDSCNAFLQGNYCEVGIGPNGAYGTSMDAPSSYHPNAPSFSFYNPCYSTTSPMSLPGDELGFVADPDKDGWTSSPGPSLPNYYGDFYLPGYPQEGWTIEIGGIEATNYTYDEESWPEHGGSGAASMSGAVTSYSNNGRTASAVWSGKYGPLAITITTTLDTGAVYFIGYVTIKNTGTTTAKSVYFMRTLDPDNDQTQSGSYVTRNVITYKNPDSENKAMVSTWGTVYPIAFCGLGTEDCRAVAFILNSGLYPTANGSAYWNHTAGDGNYDSSTEDVGVGLVFKIGDLAPGDSTALAYTYCLSIDQLDSAFAATRPKWDLNNDSVYRTTTDTGAVCRNSLATIQINNGVGYNWIWTATPSSTSISPSTGPLVNVTIGTSPIHLTATGSSPACFYDTIRMTIAPTLTPPPPPDEIFTYCQYDSTPKLTEKGINITWYTSDTATVGSKVAPKPNSYVPGTYYWYATQTVKGCESDKATIEVIVHPGSIDSFAYNIHYGCSADTVYFTNKSTGTIDYNIWKFGDGTTDTLVNPIHIYPTQDTYTVKLTTENSYNCKYNSQQKFDTRHPLKAAFTVSPDSICQYSSITFTNNSIGTGASYTWDFGDGTTDVTKSPVHQYNAAGLFTVKLIVQDFVPCYDTATTTVLVDTATAASFTVSDSVICIGKSINFEGQWSVVGNKSSLWDFGDGTIIRNTKDFVHSYDAPGKYIVKLTATYRICPDTSFTKTIEVNNYPHIDLGHDTSICPGGVPITLTDITNISNPSASWIWNDSETTGSISVSKYGIYWATVTVNGCAASDTVNVRNDCYVSIPNAFTPNGDGIDDYFLPRQLLSSGLTAFTMSIYNRWGQEVFQTSSIDGRGWDGKMNGVDQPEGVYVYLIDVVYKNGVTHHYQGNVTLLR